MEKLTYHTLVHEYTEFYDEHQRFGQYMYNKYYWGTDPWPILFYEEDAVEAFKILEKRIK